MKSIFAIAALLALTLVSATPFIKEFEKLDRFYEKLEGPFNGKIWAVLVAGSNGFYNYRHQADICHAYQILHSHGVPDEQIIVMMFDDIAENEQNPTKGIIINHPDGADVYHGVPKDYTGHDVNPQNFLNILTGNSKAMLGVGSGKVLQSGPDDHVFVYFSDHGAPGLIAFPYSELMKDDLVAAIKTMHSTNMYSDLVFYLEACESGSMFDGILPDDINVYATTAANTAESSYACYYDEKRMTYLGDRYSVAWMEDSDKENLEQESLNKQFKIVRQETNQSHVMQYGDLSMGADKVGLFQGQKTSSRSYVPLRPIYDDVPSPDVKIHILEKRIAAATTYQQRKSLKLELAKEMEIRRRIEWTTRTIAQQATDNDGTTLDFALTSSPKLTDMACYKEAVRLFDALCFELDDHEYGYRRLFVLGNLCDSGMSDSRVLSAIRDTCN